VEGPYPSVEILARKLVFESIEALFPHCVCHLGFSKGKSASDRRVYMAWVVRARVLLTVQLD
jgi:hypothetical protein